MPLRANKQVLEQCLVELGHLFPHPARIYLLENSGLTHQGARRSGVDVALEVQVDPIHAGEFVTSVGAVQDKHHVHLGYLSSAEWLPPGWETRAEYLARYGQIDVYVFDAYPVALSKLARARVSDLCHVHALIRERRLDLNRLPTVVAEVAAQLRSSGAIDTATQIERGLSRLSQMFTALRTGDAVDLALGRTTPEAMKAARQHFDGFLRLAAPAFTFGTRDGTTELVYRCHHDSFKVAFAKQYVVELLRLLRYLFDASVAKEDLAGALGSLRIEQCGVSDSEAELPAAVFRVGSHSRRLAEDVLRCTPRGDGGYQDWQAHHLTLLGGATWALTAAASVLNTLEERLSGGTRGEVLTYTEGIAQYVLADTVFVGWDGGEGGSPVAAREDA